jgi:hypothetical protein
VAKKLAIVLIALGVFLAALGVLSRFYAYPQLAVVPLDQNASTAEGAEDPPSVSQGTDATIFSLAEGAVEITTDLTSTRNTVGQVEDAEELNDATGENLAIYETFSYTQDGASRVISGTFDRVIFDRNTGEAYDCPEDVADLCDEKTGSTLSDPENTNPAASQEDIDFRSVGEEGFEGFEGQYFKMPFNTQKQDYPWWDGSIGTATDMVFVDEEEIEGLTTYKFEQAIPPTDVADQELPASVTGLEADVVADRMYSNTRTVWIEPETGVIIKAQEEQLTTFDYEDEQLITATDVTIGYTDETVQNNADRYRDLAFQLKLIRLWIPIGALVLGLVLIAVGVFMLIRNRRNASAAA